MTCSMKPTTDCLVLLVLGLCVVVVDALSSSGYDVFPEYDVCRPKTADSNPPSVFLEAPNMSAEVYVNWTYDGRALSSINCLMFFKTIANSYFQVEAVRPFDYRKCQDLINDDDSLDCITGCPHFLLFDTSYKKLTKKRIFYFGSNSSYKTESSLLHVFACGMDTKYNISMSLKLTSKEKLQYIIYNPFKADPDYIFTSPFFPEPYAKNSEYYTITLQASKDQIIVITFDDWLLTPGSYLQTGDARNADKIAGSKLRQNITSWGSTMNITFYTGENVQDSSLFLGFKAVARFYNASEYQFQFIQPVSTDCDRIITTNEAGYILLSPSLLSSRMLLQDCIWIIKPLNYDSVSLKIVKYENNNGYETYDLRDNTLEIREGITSDAPLIKIVKPNDASVNRTTSYSSYGFYIRLRGRLSFSTSVLLTYAFLLFECEDYRNNFMCGTGNICISNNLKCDGYDHCEDKSDESPSICGYETTHSSNSYPISIGVIIPLVVSAFLIIIMCLLIFLIRRCRRLNNEVHRNRIPGFQPSQNRDRRHRRRNRNVQMSVTVSSGEHPPSYDEVLQSTPIGYLNMAFTWSQHGNILTQPPSYEEAISPTAPQPSGSIIITATANNCRGEPNTNSQQQSPPTVLTTTISASLDPRAEVSSSSSSDDTADRYDEQLDISSSSDSSTENEHFLMTNNCNLEHTRSITNLNKTGENSDNSVFSQSNIHKYGSSTEGVQMVLKSPSSEKFIAVGHEDNRSENYQKMEESIKRSPHNNDDKKQNKDNDKSGKNIDDIRNVSNEGSGQRLPSLERSNEDRRYESEIHKSNRQEDFEGSVKDRRQGRERAEMYRKHKGKHSGQSSREGTSGQGDNNKYNNNGSRFQPSRVTDSSRSQSCVDLSWEAGTGRSLDADSTRIRNEDKRFSYAGFGDVSLARGGLNSFYNGRGLIREKPLEHLDKYVSQSSENLKVYRESRFGIQDHKGQYDGVSNKHDRAPDHTNNFPRNRKTKPDLHRSDSQYSALSAVQENINDEVNNTTKFHVDNSSQENINDEVNNTTKFHVDNSRYKSIENIAEHFQNGASQDKNNRPIMPSNSRSYSGAALSQTHSDDGKATHDTRSPNDVSLLSGSFHPRQHLYGAFAEDQKKFTHRVDNRRQEELTNNRHNFHNQNNEQDVKNNVTTSRSQEGARYYPNAPDFKRSFENNSFTAVHKEISHGGQDKSSPNSRPRPSLRTHVQASQKPDTEYMPKSSGQSHYQRTQKPTPAPRNLIKKQQSVDVTESPTCNEPNKQSDQASYGRPIQQRQPSSTVYPHETFQNPSSRQEDNIHKKPRPDSQYMGNPSRQVPERLNIRQNGNSAIPNEQSTGGNLAIQTTNDDVFV